MRQHLLFLLPFVLLLAACDTNEACEEGMLQIQEVTVGSGDEASASSTVTAAYEGRLEDGTVFDSNDGALFNLGNTIRGFRDGIAGMREGGERQLTIPPNLAYGEEGIPGTIPGCATLTFDVELLNVQ